MIRVAINGFGRMGRLSLRTWYQRPDLRKQLSLVAINTSGSMPVAGWAHLLKHDTVYGVFAPEIKVKEFKTPDQVTDSDCLIGQLLVEKQCFPVLAQRDPAKLPWKKYQVDVVVEATGAFRTTEKASAHLTAGAKKVLISAPGKDDGISSYVLGVNAYKGGHRLTDNASCTTNCVAPVMALINDKFGIRKASLTTIHAYTDSQNLQDGSHKDLRSARAAGVNFIPTSTGAAKATAKVIPALSGRFDGLAIRVPVVVGSISDLTCFLKKKTTAEAVNRVFTTAAKSARWQGILATTAEPLVSSDIIGRPESAIVDLLLTKVIDGDLLKVFAWYDNEWGYVNRLMEQAAAIGRVSC